MGEKNPVDEIPEFYDWVEKLPQVRIFRLFATPCVTITKNYVDPS